MLAIVAF